ncbi:MAG TPA: methyltransferase domain-containing protein [Terracidiphilus sp.]|nr:methyltransferase domain-containing protein [Terracidiphilus sp.]
MKERRFHASQAHRLDAPERLLWLPLAEIVSAAGVCLGDAIADIGAGSGYFALPLAQAAGPQGIVYAVDAQEEMLELLKRKLPFSGSGNIRLVQAEADATGLPSACCTLVFLANVWHEFDDRARVLREARRILGPGGRTAIVDWRPDVERKAGPPLEHRLTAELTMRELASAGFATISDAHVGAYHWLVLAEGTP